MPLSPGKGSCLGKTRWTRTEQGRAGCRAGWSGLLSDMQLEHHTFSQVEGLIARDSTSVHSAADACCLTPPEWLSAPSVLFPSTHQNHH